MHTAFLSQIAASLDTAWSGECETTALVQVSHSDEEWHKLLTPAAYRILRQAGTELPFSSPLESVCPPAHCRLWQADCEVRLQVAATWDSFP